MMPNCQAMTQCSAEPENYWLKVMTEIDYSDLRESTKVAAIEWIDDELCELLHSQSIRRLGQVPDDYNSLVHPDDVDDDEVEPIPEAKAKALSAIARQVKKIDYTELQPDKQIVAIDWIGKRLSESLHSHGIHRFRSIPDTPESLIHPEKVNAASIPEQDAKKVCSVAREFRIRYKSDEQRTTATPTKQVDDVGEVIDNAKDGLEVGLMASDGWQKNRKKKGDPDPRGWDIDRSEVENPEEWDNPRSLVSSAIDALSVVSARHEETISRLAWVDMDSDNPHASEHAFEMAHDQLDETFPHMVFQKVITPPWNDLPDIPKFKYPEPDDHPEVGSYTSKYHDEKQYYWKKAPQAAKKRLMSEVDVVIHMDNYQYIWQEINWADKIGCEMYIHEIEKHGVDELTDIPDHVGTPDKVPSKYVASSYNRAKDRKAKGTESNVDHSNVDDAVTTDSDVDNPERAVAPEMEGAASEHIIRGPSDTDEGRENPYLDQSATWNQNNRFDGHRRKDKERELSGNTEVNRDGSESGEDEEERDSDIVPDSA
jgi:hypothetical protein